jgi:flagellar biosynthesis protein FlgN
LNPDQAVGLRDTLKSELAAVQQFIDTLQQEQNALVSADIDTLLPLAKLKSKLADELRNLAQERTKHLTQQQLSTNRDGMNTWLLQQPEHSRPELMSLWDTLLQAGLTAQRLNETNGKLINIHLQHNQQALNTLASAANNASVYGPDGQHHPHLGAGGRSLGKV